MQESLKTLSHAVRFKSLAKYLGLIALMLAGLAVVPMLVSIGFGEFNISFRYIVVITLLLAVGLPSIRLLHPTDIQYNEALVITALAFVITPVIMSYPMMGSGLDFIDAWFEAVSAITTTGLSTIADLENMPATFLFARAWMQWYGGLGIVVFSVAILTRHHMALRRLINPSGENMVTTTQIYARRMMSVYVVLTIIGVVIMVSLLDDTFLAITLTLAAISTGGFSPASSNLADLSWQAQYGASLLGLLGAFPFILYYRIYRGSWKDFYYDIEVRAILICILILVVMLSFSIGTHLNLDWQEAFHHGFLLSISAQSTSGFSTINIAELNDFAIGLIIIAMITGGGVGSTAGGFKMLRFLILLRLLQLLIRRTALPAHAVIEPRMGDKLLKNDEIERALLLIVLFVMVVFASWLIFVAYGYAALPSLFEVASAVGTVGLSSGLSAPSLEPVLKLVLGIDMLLGRLEIIALLVVLYPGSWLGKRME